MGTDLFEMMEPFEAVLAAAAVITAILVSQAVLSTADRVTHTSGVAQVGWAAIASICLGAGLWSMNLFASLILRGVQPASFPLPHAAVAAVLAVLASFAALVLTGSGRATWLRAVGGGLVLGLAFAAVQYVGVLAFGGSMSVELDWPIASAVAAGSALSWTAVIWIAIRFAADGGIKPWIWRVGSAAIVTTAVVGVSLASFARFGRLADPLTFGSDQPLVLLSPETLLGIAAGVTGSLALLIIGASVDRRLRSRRAETEALRRSEDRFRSLVEASSQIVWTTAPDGHMLGEQLSWATFTGQVSTAYQGWGWFNAIHAEDRERTARFWEEALANRRSMELEHRVRRFDGQYRDCVARLVPVLEPDGSVREWVGTHTDVTDRTRMQQERDLLAEAGRVLSSSLDDGETLTAVARLLVPRIAEWCAIDIRSEDGSLRRLIGSHRDPNRSSLLRDLALPFLADAEHVELQGVLESGESTLLRNMTDDDLQKIMPHPESARRLKQLGGTSLLWVPLTARGQVLGVLTLASPDEGDPYGLRDLALAEELARRAAVAVDNARLYATSQLAIRARDEVLGVVSHDLRNPLGTIATAADLLLDVDLPADEQRRHLEIVRRSAKAANRLIRDLLDVTQSETGQLALDLHSIEPAQIGSDVCELMLPLAEAKGQRLSCEVLDGLPPIQADPSRIEQVLSNLIGNAIKFVPAGGSVVVRAAASAEGVQFSVADTGPGIPPEDLPRLFDRHWRGRETAHLGAGLGLAISKGIIDAHGGRIWAESEPGFGATFHFVVPTTSRGQGPQPPGSEHRSQLPAAAAVNL
ncbi:MAG: ATP-binding protein [Dehalococcoidia bacterium]